MAQGGHLDAAERWWVSAAEAGEESAGANLAAMLHSQPVLGDPAAVIRAVEVSARAGELVAMLALGELCKGRSVRRSFRLWLTVLSASTCSPVI